MCSLVAPSDAIHVSRFTSFARGSKRTRHGLQDRRFRGPRSGWLIGFLIVGLWFAGSAAAARGQSALDGFNAKANGVVNVVVVQPDGRILIGGDFTTVTPTGGVAVTRNRIARLNPNGTLDTAFDPNANGIVFAIAVQADGSVLAGGDFNGASSIGGQMRNHIARLDATTGLADSFDPNANGRVISITLQADGKVLAGGDFNGANSIGGQTRNRIARLDTTTGLADSFNPNANSGIITIVVQADGQILAGGVFTNIGGQTRNRIARLDASTGLADSFDPNAKGTVFSIAVQADGEILVGGDFVGANSIGGQTRNRIARLDATTGLADSFNPNASFTVYAITVLANGKILVGGFFNGANSIGGQTRNYIARLDPITGLADSFNPNANDIVLSIAVQEDGKILAGGLFNGANSIGGSGGSRSFIARLEIDGRLDKTLNLNTLGTSVIATAVQPDGKVLIGGNFTAVLGVARNNIARVNTDGTLDNGFNPNANGIVNTIAVQADGKILVGGAFNGANSIGGQARNRIARLDATTGVADSFDPNASNVVNTIAVQADGKILVGGSFGGANSIGGQPRNFIARLDANGLADQFNPNANNIVQAIALQPDGKILVGGSFAGLTSIGGLTRNFLARLNGASGLADAFNPDANGPINAITVQADGRILVGGSFAGLNSIGGQARNFIARIDSISGLADAFNPLANAPVFSIAVQTDGKVLVGGNFSGANSIGGQARNFIARLEATTGAADSFNPQADSTVNSIAVQADGKVLVGGLFTIIGGQAPVNYFARLTNDTIVTQDLVVTQTNITWTRGGSGPQLTRVTFEFSTEGVNYVPLGDGTPVGSNWSKAGLNLPIGIELYIRARGYYRSGFANASESITESVRNAFFTIPTGHSVSGHLTYANGTTAGKNVTMTLTGPAGFTPVQTTTDNNGDYSFSNVPAGGNYTITPSKTGAVSGISAFDASQAARFAANPGAFPLTANQQVAADASNNGSVTAFDASEIARTALNIANPGIAGTWKFSPASLTITNLSANQTNQNLTAILVGDVSGNWTPAGPSRLAPSSTTATISVALPTKQDPPGGPSTIPIAIGDTTGLGVFAYAFDISFNQAVLQPQGTAFDATGTLSSGWSINANASAPGHLIVNAFNISAMSGQGVLLYLKFNVIGGAGSTSSLTWQTCELNEGDPADTNMNGSFTATGPTAADGTINGRILSDTGLPVAGAVVRLSGTQNRKTISDGDGNYRFHNVETGGFYTITPMLVNFSFNPGAHSFSLLSDSAQAGFIATRDAVATGNPIDTPEYFVRQQYLDFLSREPDLQGWLYWSDQINQCLSEPHAVAGGPTSVDCLRQRRLDVSAAFFMSEEFQQSGNYIYLLYRAALGRQPPYAEFSADRTKVIGGTDLEVLRAQFADELVQRRGFLQKYRNATTAESFVALLLQSLLDDAQVDLSNQREVLIAKYNSSGELNQSRSAVLQAVVEISDFKSAVYNSSFVLMEYFGYLHRDIDQTGFEFWLNVLNNRDLGNYRGMVCSFITSAEYQQRFASVVSRSNGECGQ